jgi:hypothetical protein
MQGRIEMKKLLLIFAAAFLFTSCLVTTDDGECTYDSDCGFNEGCFGDECRYIPGAPPGTVTIGCNCSNTYYYPGQVLNNNSCESGSEIIQLCGYQCCDAYACYGWAWGAVCL